MIRAAVRGWSLPRPVLVTSMTPVAMAILPAIVIAPFLPLALAAAFLIGAAVLSAARAVVGDSVRGAALTTLTLVLAIAATTGTSAIDVALLRLAWTVVGGLFVLLTALAVKRLSAPAAAMAGVPSGIA